MPFSVAKQCCNISINVRFEGFFVKIPLYNFITKPFELRRLGNGGDNCAYCALLIVVPILVLRHPLLYKITMVISEIKQFTKFPYLVNIH